MDPLQRASLSLNGLSVGDSFGQTFFERAETVRKRIARRELPQPSWRFTDDTVMAIGVVETLTAHGSIDRDYLADRFAQNYHRNPWRGYGGMAHVILQAIHQGERWQDVAKSAFSGNGSYGNGAAMRVAPLGAFFADDLDALTRQAIFSAEVTHAHPEGQAGAVAVAMAAAWTWNHRHLAMPEAGPAMLAFVRDHTPAGKTRTGIERACALPFHASVQMAALTLGNGDYLTSQDTVPFVLWCAARHLDDFETALWETVSGLGDRDTTCAMVGGIVALRVGMDGIPAAWLTNREPLTDGAVAPPRI